MLEGVALKQEVIAHGDVVYGNIGASAFGIEYNIITLDSTDGYIALLRSCCFSSAGSVFLNIDFAIFYYSANGTVQGT